MKTIVFLLLTMPLFTCAQANVTFVPGKLRIPCITQMDLLTFNKVDDRYQLVTKKAVLHFRDALVACGYSYRLNNDAVDRSCSMLIPTWMNTYSWCFSDNNFMISFESDADTSGTTIILQYDLAARTTDNGNTDVTGVIAAIPGSSFLYTGRMILAPAITLAYYTNSPRYIDQLRTCVGSSR